MWWETLPSLCIVSGCLCVPSIFTYLTNKMSLGTPYKRELQYFRDTHQYLRDMRLSPNYNPYEQFGLEALDDDDDGVKTKK